MLLRIHGPGRPTHSPAPGVVPGLTVVWSLVGVSALIAAAALLRAGVDVARIAVDPLLAHEDAFYYMLTARNLAVTGVSTFDGLNVTNGYHPLWLGILALLYWLGLSRCSQVAEQVTLAALQECLLLGLVLATIMLAWRRRSTPHLAAALLAWLALLLLPTHQRVFSNGLESMLVCVFLAGYFWALWTGRLRTAGFLGAGLVLARLDMSVYIIAPAALAHIALHPGGLGQRIRSGAWLCAPALLATLAYMLSNYIQFGHAQPISGICKSSFPLPSPRWHQLTYDWRAAVELGMWSRLARLGPTTACVVVLASAAVLAVRPPRVRRWRRAAWLLLGLAALQLAAFTCFQRWGKPVEVWYLAPLVMLAGGAAVLASRELHGPRTLLAAAGLLAALSLAVYAARLVRVCAVENAPPPALYAFLRSLPRDTILGATDAGRLAYGSGLRVVNLDGLINGFPYQHALRDGRLRAYLGENGVRYLVVTTWDRPQLFCEPMYAARVAPAVFAGAYARYDFWVYSYMYACRSEVLPLYPWQEAFREAESTRDAAAESRTIVFDLLAAPPPSAGNHPVRGPGHPPPLSAATNGLMSPKSTAPSWFMSP